MSGLKVCLWFDNQAEEAVKFYVDTFRKCGREAELGHISSLVAECTISGQRIMGLNGGPHFTLSPAISLFVDCKDQAEVDTFWDGLLADGGKPSQCGWLTDRFGVSWQIVPEALGRLMSDPERGGKVGAAMMKMIKLDVAALEAAYNS